MKNGIKRAGIIVISLAVLAAGSLLLQERIYRILNEQSRGESEGHAVYDGTAEEYNLAVMADEKYIKWVDFKVSYEALCAAYELDVTTYDADVHLNWIELLAYVGTRGGGAFGKSAVSEIHKAADRLSSGETTIEELTKDMEYYSYYHEAYEAVLGGMVGEYKIQQADENGLKRWKTVYGLKAFLPIAKNFPYSDYDDFGSSRSYGYKRQHLGHDMMGQVGTPIIAIESGHVEAIGWNRYGGWRLGIRSFDGKRYYYYAHLRQNFPYALDLEEGSVVTAGDVIGYMGHTGYSTVENTNNIDTVHLHWGLQLIFHESQKEGNNEIWVDCYALTRFLYKNRSEVEKNVETKEWYRIYEMDDPAAVEYVAAEKGEKPVAAEENSAAENSGEASEGEE